MKKRLENAIFYVYRIKFSSGASYIGSHIQRNENDGYMSSSSYMKKHPEDIIEKREVLCYAKDKESLAFLETAAIMDDKCCSPMNVNYNYGNYICKLDWGFRTEDEQQMIKLKISASLRKRFKSSSMADETRSKISESLKSVWASMSEEERKLKRRKATEAMKRFLKNETDEHKKAKIEKQKDTIRSHPSLHEAMTKRCIENNRKTSKRCRCVETGKVFESLGEAARWASPYGEGSKISRAIRIKCSAYKDPATKIPLHWEWA